MLITGFVTFCDVVAGDGRSELDAGCLRGFTFGRFKVGERRRRWGCRGGRVGAGDGHGVRRFVCCVASIVDKGEHSNAKWEVLWK